MSEEGLSDLFEEVAGRFDLGEYEMEAYLTVLEHGSIAASELADRTTIPQPRIYDTVRSLDERGLIELHESRPMRAVAIDPAEAFAGISSALDGLIEDLQARYSAPDPDQAAVSLIKSRSTILRNIRDVIEGADYELALALTPELLVRYEEELREARARDVSIELIVAPADQAPSKESFAYASVATAVRVRRGVTTPVVAVADGERSIYATQDAFRRDQERYGVIFNRSALGFLLFGFYGTVLWTTADPIVQPKADPPFPRRYASVRRCIKELRTLEGTFYAVIEGRWVTSGDPCTLRGKVTEASMRETGEVATLSIETDEGTFSVGGRLAAYEDVEAHEIRIGLDSPPA